MIRKFRDPAQALQEADRYPETTLLGAHDSEGEYWLVARRSYLRGAPWSILAMDGRMVIREGQP